MAQHFDSNAGFGVERPVSGFWALRLVFIFIDRFDNGQFRHPMIVLSHIGFRGAALFFYFFANVFSSSFIIQFLVIVSLICCQCVVIEKFKLTLLSADFWTVKNITGRLLVGLRWFVHLYLKEN
jgi:hypothetical protein